MIIICVCLYGIRICCLFLGPVMFRGLLLYRLFDCGYFADDNNNNNNNNNDNN